MAVSTAAVAAIAVGCVSVYAGIKGISIPQAIQAIVQGRSPSTLAQANPIKQPAPPPDNSAGGGGNPNPPGNKAPGDLSGNPGGGSGGGGSGSGGGGIQLPQIQPPQVAPPAQQPPPPTHIREPPPKPSYPWWDPRGWF